MVCLKALLSEVPAGATTCLLDLYSCFAASSVASGRVSSSAPASLAEDVAFAGFGEADSALASGPLPALQTKPYNRQTSKAQ